MHLNAPTHSVAARAEPVHSVVLVDALPIVREGLALRLQGEGGLRVAGQAGSRPEAQLLVARHRPELAVVDLVLDVDDGLELVSWIRAHHAATRVLVFSTRDAAIYGERALRAGAVGYVGKHEPVVEVVRAMRTVLAGGIHAPRELTESLVSGVCGHRGPAGREPLEVLTDRELQVFEILGTGRTSQQIADALNLSMKTVATHRAHIQKKLGIPTFGELARRAVLWVEGQRAVTGPHPRP